MALNSNPEVPRKFPKLPRKSPNFPGSSPDFPGGQPLSLGSLTPSPDSQKLSLINNFLFTAMSSPFRGGSILGRISMERRGREVDTQRFGASNNKGQIREINPSCTQSQKPGNHPNVGKKTRSRSEKAILGATLGIPGHSQSNSRNGNHDLIYVRTLFSEQL